MGFHITSYVSVTEVFVCCREPLDLAAAAEAMVDCADISKVSSIDLKTNTHHNLNPNHNPNPNYNTMSNIDSCLRDFMPIFPSQSPFTLSPYDLQLLQSCEMFPNCPMLCSLRPLLPMAGEAVSTAFPIFLQCERRHQWPTGNNLAAHLCQRSTVSLQRQQFLVTNSCGCTALHCLALRTGAKPRYNTPTPGLLAKPCTLVHLRSSARYTIQPGKPFKGRR